MKILVIPILLLGLFSPPSYLCIYTNGVIIFARIGPLPYWTQLTVEQQQ
ncbi:hypothetical protein BH09SUM1_BH09SUM1_09530 [soil metagenome]